MATEQKKGFTQADIMTLLDTLYQKVLAGVPKVSVPVSTMALDYMSKHSTKEVAAKAMLKNQVIKCATSGFLTGFGGIVTLPVAIPANISSVLYVQMRMIACTAYMPDTTFTATRCKRLYTPVLRVFLSTCWSNGSALNLASRLLRASPRKFPDVS